MTPMDCFILALCVAAAWFVVYCFAYNAFGIKDKPDYYSNAEDEEDDASSEDIDTEDLVEEPEEEPAESEEKKEC